MQNLKIQDDTGNEGVVYDTLTTDAVKDKTDQQVEVHVLQSGQIDFSTPTTAASSSEQYSSNMRCDDDEASCTLSGSTIDQYSFKHQDREPTDKHSERTGVRQSTESSTDVQLMTSSKDMTVDSMKQPDEPGTNAQSSVVTSLDVTPASGISTNTQTSTLTLTGRIEQASGGTQDRSTTQAGRIEQFRTDVHQSLLTPSNDVTTQTARPSSIKDPPLIIRRSRHAVHDNTSQCTIPPDDRLQPDQSDTSSGKLPPDQPNAGNDRLPPHPPYTGNDRLSPDVPNASNDRLPLDQLDTGHKLPRRSSRRLSQRLNIPEETTTSPKRGAYNLRHKQNLADDLSPPTAKRRHLDGCGDNGLDTDPLQWGIAEVTRFISTVPRCDCTEVFMEHVSTKN